MKDSIYYKYEKMAKARYVLAASRSTLRDRIDDSYHQFWLLKDDEFPSEGKTIRKEIQYLITKNKPKKGCVIPHNIRYMPLARAEEIAGLILDLYDVVAKEYLANRS